MDGQTMDGRRTTTRRGGCFCLTTNFYLDGDGGGNPKGGGGGELAGFGIRLSGTRRVIEIIRRKIWVGMEAQRYRVEERPSGAGRVGVWASMDTVDV
jgi:hypothetical protein